MGHILSLASASAALTTALGLFAGIGSESLPAAPASHPPQVRAVAAAEAAPARAIRTIPIDGRYGAAVLPTRR